jgi:hypothetical protein
MPSARVSPELLDKILSTPGILVNGKPVAQPDPPTVDDAAEEKAFQAQVIQFATEHGWAHFHVYNSRKSVAGWPDLVLVRGPVILFAELKSRGGRTTADQERWIELLRGARQTVFVWRPSDWPEIRSILEVAA